MSKKVKFAMNTGHEGGKTVIQQMARPAIETAATRIADRANRISASMRNHPQTFEPTPATLGLRNRYGDTRVYVDIKAAKPNGGEAYNLDYQALRLALDAGRVSRLSG